MKRFRRHLLIILFLILLCAVANFVIAIHGMRGADRNNFRSLARGTLPGPPTEWPAPIPPQSQPWPKVGQIDYATSFGYRQLNAHGAPNEPQVQMEIEEFGWPIPVLARRQYWWPWDDRKWGPQDDSETGLLFVWRGVFLTPIVGAVAIWLALVWPFVLAALLTRLRRQRQGRCERCGHQLAGKAVCPECGNWTTATRVAA